MPAFAIRPALEMMTATRFPNIAARMPCMKGHAEAMTTMLRGTTRIIREAIERAGPTFLEVVRDQNAALGAEIGAFLSERYALGEGVEAALKLVQLQIIPFDIRMRVLECGDDRAVFEKLACPMWDVFRSEGVDYCDAICLAATEGAVRVIDEDLRARLQRRPDSNKYCVKVIERRNP